MVYASESLFCVSKALLPGFGMEVGFLGIIWTWVKYEEDKEGWDWEINKIN